ncbi:hypothetical protein R3Q06_36060 [Rhodococcus erythropolis]|uniref:hypothetical protein n=1 Tax=Rhodococcus erythropolis TaxID=1833 RepID=UPI002949E1C7|nr:hypothetical protein [Rhodococcus erythropolis]MDV6278783.1 hypothetical protein [Rhodococcus erythropolis]
MALNVNLVAKYFLGPGTRAGSDPAGWNRTWAGYDPDADDEVNFEHNRGLWTLAPWHGSRERIATMSVGHVVRIVADIDGIEGVTLPGGSVKHALVGRVLRPGDPDHDRFVGTVVPAYRNPVHYLPGSDAMCLCGCGIVLSSARRWVPGHDQRALHKRVRERWGTIEHFVSWYDTQPHPQHRPDVD